MFQEFINTYGMEIISAAVAGIIGFVGLAIKTLVKNLFDDKTKSKVAKTAVKAVEQIYKDLKGEEKFIEAMNALIAMLEEKSISITELEAQMLIEESVKDLNINFQQIKDEIDKL